MGIIDIDANPATECCQTIGRTFGEGTKLPPLISVVELTYDDRSFAVFVKENAVFDLVVHHQAQRA
jgi:hypothetical protein